MFFVYGANNSKACDRAEFLLCTLGYEYKIYRINVHYTLAQLERLVPGVKTVPQIYHGTQYIGGMKELNEFLQKSESLGDRYFPRLARIEKLIDNSTKDGQNHSGVQKEE
jgi:glutaredoxin